MKGDVYFWFYVIVLHSVIFSSIDEHIVFNIWFIRSIPALNNYALCLKFMVYQELSVAFIFYYTRFAKEISA